jgi:phosphoribosylaminoimidazolecarboxamide formyltransferase/IMP cyclohydrolase
MSVFNAMTEKELTLRYGCNPHQTPARIYAKEGVLPISFLNGFPSYINLLDALNSWQLVKDLKEVLHLPAAASFKHVSPTGAAVGMPLSDTLRQAYFVDVDLELPPLAMAYARARGSDRVSSYGDWAAFSDPVDVATAQLLRPEVSDGVIAPGYEPQALDILKQKRKGNYMILEIDPAYTPDAVETREVFGLVLEQPRNQTIPSTEHLQQIVTRNQELPKAAQRDMLVSLICLKYTQSNSVCLALDGQIIGIGAGQQSRIGCTRIAIEKAQQWYLRQHPDALTLPFCAGLRRPERDNVVAQYCRADPTPTVDQRWREALTTVPRILSDSEKWKWLANLRDVTLGSDGHFPFRDNIEVAYQSGVKYVVQPGQSLRDGEVIAACDDYGMVMVFSGLRLFHH